MKSKILINLIALLLAGLFTLVVHFAKWIQGHKIIAVFIGIFAILSIVMELTLSRDKREGFRQTYLDMQSKYAPPHVRRANPWILVSLSIAGAVGSFLLGIKLLAIVCLVMLPIFLLDAWMKRR